MTVVQVRSDSSIDVAAMRADTLGTQESHHFNSAGSALPTHAVVNAAVEHLRLEQRCGGYEAAAMVRDRVDAVYESAARLIGARAEEIALFESATAGLRVLIDALRLGPDTRLIVSRSSYVSHALHLMTIARERQVELTVIPNDAGGSMDLEAYEKALAAGGSAVVCAAHIPTSSGLIEPVEQIGRLAGDHGARFILDATQSVGQLEMDVARIGCDALVTTGRKFLRGPRGTGFAYVDADLLARLLPTAPDVRGATWTDETDWDLAPTARRFEGWESSVAGRLGLGVALDQAIDRGMAATEAHLRTVAALVRDRLAAIPGVTLTDPPQGLSAIVTFTVAGHTPERVVAQLASKGVRVVSVPAGHAQWDLGARQLVAVVRASLHVYNDQADIDALLDGVAAIARQEG